MIQDSVEKAPKQAQELKKFIFFQAERMQQKADDPLSHPIKLRDLAVVDAAMIGPRILLLDKNKNQIYVYVKNIEGCWSPYNGSALRMVTNDSSEDGVLLTYGEDAEGQSHTGYIKLWKVGGRREEYEQMAPLRKMLVGEIGRAERQISCLHFIRDMSLISVGSRRGMLTLMESKSMLQYDPRVSDKMVDKKEIRMVRAVKRMGETDIYFSTEDSFFWFENLSEKRRLVQSEAENIESTVDESVLVTFRGDNRAVHEFKGGKELRNWVLEGEKKIIGQYRRDYLVLALFEKKNEKNESTEKYRLQILDTKNQYIAYFDTYARIESILTNRQHVVVVGELGKGERVVTVLTEKDNSFKFQTLTRKSFFSEAWRFAYNQNCEESLLAEISRLHGDLLYTKDLGKSIHHYIKTLGFVEPSYVIRRFLDVSQIDYLIEYLEKIHEKKMAKKEHTALLLNCYVKKQRIENLSQFLSESSIESDLFDIETAIKVCKDLKHFDEAMKLAEQKNKHELFLKILIEDKRDYRRALDHIRTRVEMEEKEKYIIEFGQEFMKILPQETIELIKLMVRAHSISQVIRGREREYMLSQEERGVLEQLHFNMDELESLEIITFKKPDEYFRLFLLNNEDLENFLNYLIREIPKLPHEQIVFHRLMEFYMERIKNHPDTKHQCEEKILDNLKDTHKKYDSNQLLALFKMSDFDLGVITLCKKLGMRDDLLNFYISRRRDQDILELCREHGREEVNLWIHALKYFVKPEYKKEYYLPDILDELSLIENLSPLPILSILSKNKNIPYRYVKEFCLSKLKRDRQEIGDNKEVVQKNMRQSEGSRAEFKKLKTTSKAFIINICAFCHNKMTIPSIHFMCGHSFHENCLSGEKECSVCGYEMRNIITRKQKYAEGANDQTKLFEALEERKATGFDVVAEYMGKGLFKNKIDL